MKKILTIAGMLMALIMMASCGSTSNVSASSDVPEWYVIEPESKDGIYGTGQAKMADFDTSLKLAEANAYNSLARKVSTVVKDVTQTMVSGSKTDTMKGFEENALQVSEATLEGARRTNFYQGKDGTVYIQMFLPYETSVSALNKTAEKYEISAEYLATQVKMQEAYEKYFSKGKKH
ncbi:MAG: LPP20 family lipoprotein [Treponema sp.]|nr:LPP20 family lipoprotein [Candidatus Treponema equifaecale]